MKNLIIKELDLDSSEELIEWVCSSDLIITHKTEKGLSNQTIEHIISFDPEEVTISITSRLYWTMITISDNNHIGSIDLRNCTFDEIVIR